MPQKQNSKRQKDIAGIIFLTRRGVGYVSVSGFDEDIEIRPEDLNTALHGDEVSVRLLKPRAGARRRGAISRVLKRAQTQFVGTLQKNGKHWTLIPDNKRMYVDIRVRAGKNQKLHKNQKALVELLEWNDPGRDPTGKVLEVLGPAGAHNVEMRSIVLSQGFATGFPKEVEQEAEEIKKNREALFEATIQSRKDFRDITTFTIDPVDAKDFDDAISIAESPDGTYQIGVHIADVSYYAKPKSELDTEAKKRGTSIYLVDRTIPMFPEILSNDICSLVPNEDRLTYSAVFMIDKNGAVQHRWFGETVIHSDKRFSYEEAQGVLDKGVGPFAEELKILNGIAYKLREKRFRSGSIGFDQDEVKFELDTNGKPIRVFKKTRTDTNLLIEDFMLLANQEVAGHISNLNKKNHNTGAFVYRVHDIPDPEKIEELRIFLHALGHDLPAENGIVRAKDINALFREIEGKPEEDLIKLAAVRAMAKAVYTTKNIGHFGLAFSHYTHFTSPIRRYPDVMVHRILRSHANGTPIPKKETAMFEQIAVQSSEREVAAIEAERESIKYKQVEYMQERVGEEFDGVITGVAEHGMYVEETETKAEGMVRLGLLKDDYYVFDKSKYRLVGEKTKKKYALGDRVRVKLLRADLEERQIDWELAAG